VQDWESNVFCSPLLLADNYNQTTNDPTTETQSARRTHRDFLAERSDAVSTFAILARYRQQRRATAGPRFLRRSCPGCCSLAAACGPGRPGLRRYRQGGLDCLAGTGGQEVRPDLFSCGACVRIGRFFRRQLRVRKPEIAKRTNMNYLNKSISTGRPTLMKNLANAWDKCSR